MFKFVRRESLDPKIDIHNPFFGAEESPRDVVLLVSAFMGSLDLAQVPEVCFPLDGLKYLGDPRTLQICSPGNHYLNGKVVKSCELRIWWKHILGSWTARRSTCELWFLTMLAEALLLGQPR